jgi:hypothetical protein
LIHDDELIRNYVWRETFKGYLIYDTISLLFNIVITTVIVFVTCVIVDKIRMLFIEKYYIKFIDKYNIDKMVANMFYNLLNKKNETRKI